MKFSCDCWSGSNSRPITAIFAANLIGWKVAGIGFRLSSLARTPKCQSPFKCVDPIWLGAFRTVCSAMISDWISGNEAADTWAFDCLLVRLAEMSAYLGCHRVMIARLNAQNRRKGYLWNACLNRDCHHWVCPKFLTRGPWRPVAHTNSAAMRLAGGLFQTSCSLVQALSIFGKHDNLHTKL